MKTYDVDVVVVGAGPTGAHAATVMARQGLQVVLLDQAQAGLAGAQWLNGVPDWMYDEAGLDRPGPDEAPGGGEVFTMFSPDRQHKLPVHNSPVLEVDMRALGRRTRELYEDSAERVVLWRHRVVDFEYRPDGRLEALIVASPKGRRRFRASLFVDASGMAAVLRKNSALRTYCEPVPREHICVAAQEVHHIEDPEGARAFLAQHGLEPGENMSCISLHGGFSLLRVLVSEDLEHVSILTGSIAEKHIPSGRQILDTFLTESPWIGAKRFGGSRAIPLRRPYTHLVADGVALIGDSACQVFSAHGSGVGIGLVAAKLLGDTVAGAHRAGLDIGSLGALWPYAATFHKRWGGLLGNSDAFRRFSQTLSPEEASAMLAAGLLTESMVLDTLAQRPSTVRVHDLPAVSSAVPKVPGVVAKLAPVLVRQPLINWNAKHYPEEVSLDGPGMARYERVMQGLVDSL